VDGLGMGHWLLVNLGFQKKWVELMGDPQVPQVTMAFNIQHMVQELDELGVPEKKKRNLHMVYGCLRHLFHKKTW
jgi:hypothetical protein